MKWPFKWCLRWHWLPPEPGDIAAIVQCVAFAMFQSTVGTPHLRRSANWDFRPDCDCSYVPQGEPVCIKHTAAAP